MSAESEAIFHLVWESELRARSANGQYRPDSLASEGFVHCSRRAQVLAVADDYFPAREESLLVLELDPTQLSSEVRDEAPAPLPHGGRRHLRDAPRFPHVYGPIDLRAIRRVGVVPRAGATHAWPEHFGALQDFLVR